MRAWLARRRWYIALLVFLAVSASEVFYHPVPLAPSLHSLWDYLSWVALGFAAAVLIVRDLGRREADCLLAVVTAAVGASGFGDGNFVIGPLASLALAWCMWDFWRTFR